MIVSMYLFMVSAALALFVLGVIENELSFLGMSVVLFLVSGFYSFDLTYITSSGNVLTVEGGWPLGFLWWGFAMIDILAIMIHGLSLKGGTQNA